MPEGNIIQEMIESVISGALSMVSEDAEGNRTKWVDDIKAVEGGKVKIEIIAPEHDLLLWMAANTGYAVDTFKNPQEFLRDIDTTD
jgi:hypothetical protein